MDINTDTNIVEVQALQKEYEALLILYQEAVQSYIEILKSNKSSIFMTSGAGVSWWGTSRLAEGTAETEQDCQNMCTTDLRCSGATFNRDKHYCWTRIGNNGFTYGDKSDVAIVTKETMILERMNAFNRALLELNDKISEKLSAITPQMEETKVKNAQTQNRLDIAYRQLLKQKHDLDIQKQKYINIEENQTNRALFVNQQQMIYEFWVLLGCVIVFMTFQGMIGLSWMSFLMSLIVSYFLYVFFTKIV